MKNMGTFNSGIVGTPSANGNKFVSKMSDKAIASGQAFLISEIGKRDPLIRQPLTAVTYTRDIPLKSGGGWVETISALNIDYGVTGGSGAGAVGASGANATPVIQANLGKDTFKSHVFESIMRIKFIDMQREAITGRSLDTMLQDGVRLNYDKHMDQNTYLGFAEFGTEGLLNKSTVVAQSVVNGASGQTDWSTKTADEILADINNAITDVWDRSGNDLSAIPNHIILPYKQYNYIATAKVSPLAEKTILSYVLENNIATKNGETLVIGATAFCKGAGAGATDRMAVYVHNDRFIAEEELVPLTRTMTQPNVDALAYDSVFMANVSEVEVFYDQTIGYFDGI